jgi:hypothetical protein
MSNWELLFEGFHVPFLTGLAVWYDKSPRTKSVSVAKGSPQNWAGLTHAAQSWALAPLYQHPGGCSSYCPQVRLPLPVLFDTNSATPGLTHHLLDSLQMRLRRTLQGRIGHLPT